jgi:hypothetical protein
MAPILEGGKNVLDLRARNEAISCMKLKSYLELDPSLRADWCYLADTRLAKHDVKNSRVDPLSHINMFTFLYRASI